MELTNIQTLEAHIAGTESALIPAIATLEDAKKEGKAWLVKVMVDSIKESKIKLAEMEAELELARLEASR